MNLLQKNRDGRSMTVFAIALVAVFALVGVARAATTIGTDIQTDGNLSVTGTSMFTGSMSIATSTSSGSLNIAGPYGANAVVIDQQNPVTDITARPAILISNSDTTSNNYALLGFTTTLNGQPAAKIGAQFTNRASDYADLVFGTRNSSGMNEVMRITSTGNVGIGTTTPTSPFMIQSDTYPQFQIVNHADQGLEIHPWFGLNYVDIDPVQNGATVLFGDNQTAATWSFMTGNVGIGTTTPQSKLQVTSGANATTTVTVGELGLSTSKACVNMNASDGSAASFYINGAHQMVVEAHYCR